MSPGHDRAAALGHEERADLLAAAGAWLIRRLAAERERWALWLPVAFGAGIALYFGLDREPDRWLGLTGLAGAAVLGLVGRARPGLVLLAIALGTLSAGFAAAQLRTALVAAPVVEKRIGPVAVEGVVLSVEPRATRGPRVLLRPEVIDSLPAAATPARVRVSLGQRTPALRPGDRVRLRAVLRPPPEPAAPGAFDFARQAYFQRLGAVGFGLGAVERLDAAAAESGFPAAWRLWWSSLRHDVARRILAALPGRSGAVAAALMTGERGAIPEPVLTAMRDSGLAHLLAISGLHVGLVAGLLFFGLRAVLALVPRLVLYHPTKKWAAVAAALGAGAYLALTGAPAPTQRAFLMVALALLAVLLDRTALSLRLVAWAAFAVLLLAPESLLSASFQMSFAAVTALIAAYEALRDRRGAMAAERRPLGRLARHGGALVLTSLVAGLATAPFGIYHFNRVAWYGLAANLVAVPLTALWIMPWAIVAFALMPFGAERLALVPMGWGIEVVLTVAEAVAAWPGAVSLIPAMPLVGLAMIVLGGLWLCLWRGRWRLAGVAPILAGVLSVPLHAPPDVLANGNGRLIGVRAPDGILWLSTSRAHRFEADIWRRRAGLDEAESWPRAGGAADGRLRCDPLGCIYRSEGHVVALVRDSRALRDDCAAATVVVSSEPVRRGACPGRQLVIDRFDLWREGGHALWLSPAGVRVETVAERRGRRPWSPGRGRD